MADRRRELGFLVGEKMPTSSSYPQSQKRR